MGGGYVSHMYTHIIIHTHQYFINSQLPNGREKFGQVTGYIEGFRVWVFYLIFFSYY